MEDKLRLTPLEVGYVAKQYFIAVYSFEFVANRTFV